jgi:tripartite-type tricarboxylate transporter receptor subunit TctC
MPPNALAGTLLALMAVAIAPQSIAQPYPSRPIRLIVPFPPGGVTDLVGRILAQRLGDGLGRAVVVDNRGGANGAIGAQAAARAAPDGYTLLMATATHAINATLSPAPGFDLRTDLAPISLAATVPLLLAAHPSLPVRSVRDLVNLARANPGRLDFVPFKGGGPAIQDLLAGQIPMMFENLPSILPHVQSGRLRGLAVTATARTAAAPQLPTMIESGYAGFVAGSWYGLFAPAGTPREVVSRLNAETVRTLKTPDTRSLLSQQGADPVGNTEAEFAAFIASEIERWAKVIRTARIRIEP